MIDRYADRWALVTGASSGIGEEFAKLLAARGMHLVLVARRKDRLEAIAADLHTRHGTICDIIPLDLTSPEAARQLVEEIDSRDRTIEMLVNNAGFAVVSDVAATEIPRVMEMLRLNIGALTEITLRILPGMMERGHGAIVNISSVAAFQPVAYMASYAATKAYVLHYSEALWAEARDKGVTVMALCPGVTRTEFFEVAGVSGWLKKQRSQSPDQVVRRALRALERKRQYTVPGFWDYLRSLVVRLAPRKRVVLETLRYFRPQKKKKKRDDEQPADPSAEPPEPPSKVSTD